MSADETRGPADRCACGDLYWRHGNGNDGGPCQVYSKTNPDTHPLRVDAFERCDCAGFELAEDDL